MRGSDIPFTIDEVAAILKLLRELDVEVFELRTGDLDIVAYSGLQADARLNPRPSEVSVPESDTIPRGEAISSEEPSEYRGEPAAIDVAYQVIVSPMVGVFYVAPEPGAEPFVVPGALVTPDTTVGMVEAMKLFTAVKANVSGQVHEVLVENGTVVEFGQPLVTVQENPVAAS